MNGKLLKGNNYYLRNLLANFTGVDSEFGIKIVSKSQVFVNNKEVNGSASSPNLDNIILIKISSLRASNRSVLAIAKTLIHEYVHADMFRKLNTQYTTQSDLDFLTTYNYYASQKFQASPQHETMANLYVDEIANTLKYFHMNEIPKEYNYITQNGTINVDDLYEAMAWQGLKEHNVQAYYDLSSTRQAQLDLILAQYYHGLTIICTN